MKREEILVGLWIWLLAGLPAVAQFPRFVASSNNNTIGKLDPRGNQSEFAIERPGG